MLVSNLCYVGKWMVLRRHFQDGLMNAFLVINTTCLTIFGAGGVSDVCFKVFITIARIIDVEPNV